MVQSLRHSRPHGGGFVDFRPFWLKAPPVRRTPRVGGPARERRVRRFLRVSRGYAAVLLAGVLFLSGCGFVNVAELRPPLLKQSVVVLVPGRWFASSQVVSAIRSAPAGVSAVEVLSPSTAQGLANVLARFRPRWVVVDGNAPWAAQLAGERSGARFAVVAAAPPSGAAVANETWVVPDPAPLASLAGYIAGGLIPQGSLSVSPATAADAALLAALSSGLHAAFSSALAVSGQPTVTQSVYGGPPSPLPVVYVSLPGQSAAPPQNVSGWVDFSGGSAGGAGYSPVARLSGQGLFSAGVRAALLRAAGGPAGGVVFFNALPSAVLQGYRGWPGPAGVENYVRLLTGAKVSPAGFAAAAPTAPTARLLGLPLPAPRRGGSGAPLGGGRP